MRAPLVTLTLSPTEIHHESDCARGDPAVTLLENLKSGQCFPELVGGERSVPTCVRVLGVIRAQLKFAANLPLILEQGKPVFLLCVFCVYTDCRSLKSGFSWWQTIDISRFVLPSLLRYVCA